MRASLVSTSGSVTRACLPLPPSHSVSGSCWALASHPGCSPFRWRFRGVRRLARTRSSRARPCRARRDVLRTWHRAPRGHVGWHWRDRRSRFLTEDHLYARDLDIFGPASLFQLLSRARTHLGEELLARWLSAPADVTTVRQRQQSVDELRGALDFREALATAGGASRDIDTVALSAWASAPAAPESIWLRSAAVVLAAGHHRWGRLVGAGWPVDSAAGRNHSQDDPDAAVAQTGRAHRPRRRTTARAARHPRGHAHTASSAPRYKARGSWRFAAAS